MWVPAPQCSLIGLIRSCCELANFVTKALSAVPLRDHANELRSEFFHCRIFARAGRAVCEPNNAAALASALSYWSAQVEGNSRRLILLARNAAARPWSYTDENRKRVSAGLPATCPRAHGQDNRWQHSAPGASGSVNALSHTETQRRKEMVDKRETAFNLRFLGVFHC
jgi:hypothetical protein